MDALSEILRTARLTGGVFLHANFTEPWCLSSKLKASDCSQFLGPTDHLVLFHYVLEGTLNVVADNGHEETFLPGQAVILPRNDPHVLKGCEPTSTIPALDVTERNGPGELMTIMHGGGGDETRIVCGFLSGRGLQHNPLLNALPTMFRYDGAANPSGQTVRSMLDFAANEVAKGRLGSEAILASISELLFSEAVRDYVEITHSSGLLLALKDRAVSKAIGLLHRAPEKKWTVPMLARECAVSQTVLTERFNKMLRCTPGDYLTTIRMQIAARELLYKHLSVVEAADRVGYGSEAAFSRAFKRHYGVSPSEWRKHYSNMSNIDDRSLHNSTEKY